MSSPATNGSTIHILQDPDGSIWEHYHGAHDDVLVFDSKGRLYKHLRSNKTKDEGGGDDRRFGSVDASTPAGFTVVRTVIALAATSDPDRRCSDSSGTSSPPQPTASGGPSAGAAGGGGGGGGGGLPRCTEDPGQADSGLGTTWPALITVAMTGVALGCAVSRYLAKRRGAAGGRAGSPGPPGGRGRNEPAFQQLPMVDMDHGSVDI